MEKKIIINVGRQLGSGGYDIAKALAEIFNCKLYDKEILNLAAKESGFSEKFFEENDEQKEFMKTHFHINIPILGNNDFYNNNFSQEGLYKFQSDAILHITETNPRCVFVGRTADYILRNNKNAVNIFITADIEKRIANVAKRMNISSQEAKKFIDNKEYERSKYYNYYTGKTWGKAESYHLTVNATLLGQENATKLIADFVNIFLSKNK